MKARSLNVPAEDYLVVKVNNVNYLFQGRSQLDNISLHVIDTLYKNDSCNWQDVLSSKPLLNHYFILRNANVSSVSCFYNVSVDKLEVMHKTSAYGIRPRNTEQTVAMHAVLNPDTIKGIADTGKTLW